MESETAWLTNLKLDDDKQFFSKERMKQFLSITNVQCLMVVSTLHQLAFFPTKTITICDNFLLKANKPIFLSRKLRRKVCLVGLCAYMYGQYLIDLDRNSFDTFDLLCDVR